MTSSAFDLLISSGYDHGLPKQLIDINQHTDHSAQLIHIKKTIPRSPSKKDIAIS